MKVASQLRVPASVLGEGISSTNIVGDLVDPRTFLEAVEKKNASSLESTPSLLQSSIKQLFD
jgi:hypothetical protein